MQGTKRGRGWPGGPVMQASLARPASGPGRAGFLVSDSFGTYFYPIRFLDMAKSVLCLLLWQSFLSMYLHALGHKSTGYINTYFIYRAMKPHLDLIMFQKVKGFKPMTMSWEPIRFTIRLPPQVVLVTSFCYNLHVKLFHFPFNLFLMLWIGLQLKFWSLNMEVIFLIALLLDIVICP